MIYRHSKSVDWFINIFDRYLHLYTNEEIKNQFRNIYEDNSSNSSGDQSNLLWLELYETILQLVVEFKALVKEFDLYHYTIPKLNHLYSIIQTSLLASNYNKVFTEIELQLYQKYLDLYMLLLNDIKIQYGLQCIARKEYSEALTAMLSTQPIQAIHAIEVARLMGTTIPIPIYLSFNLYIHIYIHIRYIS